ncbi:MAG: NADH-quinone oxidoreductase subunit A [Anaerolineales bacterium]|nr:NADH-quinone oxidoreductase subunit A [Anaerolineales bacterium]
MLLEYLPIAILIVLATGLASLVVILGHLFGPKRQTDAKAMPYESGMNPYGPGTRRMSVKFYLIAVLFILFDIEIIFFLPWAVVLRDFVDNSLGIFALVEMFVFITILLVGYVYAWKKGALEWE